MPVDEHEQIFMRDQPMNALLELEDVADSALRLASDESRQVTWTVITVNGGFSVR
ncbi:SDR family oxidoreductase [Streptomyces canus]|uniref:SDR family oxidoreductase n=1 Tax=Streptomyces canus TaxID=58343 RepID=UPI00369C5CC2